MPDYRRRFRPGGTYFFAVVTYDRMPILASPEARDVLRRALRTTLNRFPFSIDAIVVLPDHLHAIWTLPDGDHDFPRRWSMLKRVFTQRYVDAGGTTATTSASQRNARRAGVWQRRYWEHLIRDEDDYARHVEYVLFSPVKHGLVDCPHAWPASSFHYFARDGVYDEHWLCRCGGREPTTPKFESISRFTGE